jgi:hypothetical protein
VRAPGFVLNGIPSKELAKLTSTAAEIHKNTCDSESIIIMVLTFG